MMKFSPGGSLRTERKGPPAHRLDGYLPVYTPPPYPPAFKSTEWTLQGPTVNTSGRLNIEDIKETYGLPPKTQRLTLGEAEKRKKKKNHVIISIKPSYVSIIDSGKYLRVVGRVLM